MNPKTNNTDTKTKPDVKAATSPAADTAVDKQPPAEKPETPQQTEMSEALAQPETAAVPEAAKEANAPLDKTAPAKAARADGLPPELLELVSELRDTVRGINPKKHTAKTLRRSLANVSDILTDIEKVYHKNEGQPK